MWLNDFDSQMLQQALADLRRAYINFFERRAKFPRFKTKKRCRPAFRIPQRVRVEGERVSNGPGNPRPARRGDETSLVSHVFKA